MAVSNPIQSVFSWLSDAPSLLFGQKEPAGTKSTTGYSQGIDIPLGLDTPIGNVLPGRVVEANYFPWGGQVDIESMINGLPTVTEYLHLDQIGVQMGQLVNSGTLIGLSGGQLSGGSHPATSAFSTGPHIKFSEFTGASQADINSGQWGAAVNPAGLLNSASMIFGGTQATGGAFSGLGDALNAAAGVTPTFKLISQIVSFITSANFAKIFIGGLLVLIAVLIFVIPSASETAEKAAPLFAAAAV